MPGSVGLLNLFAEIDYRCAYISVLLLVRLTFSASHRLAADEFCRWAGFKFFVQSFARFSCTTNDQNFKTYFIALERHVLVGGSSAMNLTRASEKVKRQQELRHIASGKTMWVHRVVLGHDLANRLSNGSKHPYFSYYVFVKTMRCVETEVTRMNTSVNFEMRSKLWKDNWIWLSKHDTVARSYKRFISWKDGREEGQGRWRGLATGAYFIKELSYIPPRWQIYLRVNLKCYAFYSRSPSSKLVKHKLMCNRTICELFAHCIRALMNEVVKIPRS